MDIPLSIFTPEGTEPDAGAVQQMHTCMEAGGAVAGSLSADHHLGYSAPIGASIAYPDYISPSGVGYDIGCGNKAVATSLLYQDVRKDLVGIMDEITRRISFGMGVPAAEEVKDHPVFDQIAHAALSHQRRMLGKARSQLGTVGSGNHYVDLFRDEKTDRVWVGVHFGSRGFGHGTASGFLALAAGLEWGANAPGGEMHSPPVLLDTRSPLGFMYIEAMRLAGEYAYAGRDVVCDKVLEILGAQSVDEVHNHHNFAWREQTPYGHAWVIRKGATPLWPGQRGFVGGSMGENAVIIEGFESFTAHDALHSAPHGAGRAMSRTEAAGKRRKRQYCDRCGYTQQPGTPRLEVCPGCNASQLGTKWIQEKEGKVDWKAAKARLAASGIILKGGGADEAPEAYKRLPEVLNAHLGHVRILHELRPIGVAMAGPDVRDHYKD
jgi:tRNA-splicing ligase RtcB